MTVLVSSANAEKALGDLRTKPEHANGSPSRWVDLMFELWGKRFTLAEARDLYYKQMVLELLAVGVSLEKIERLEC